MELTKSFLYIKFFLLLFSQTLVLYFPLFQEGEKNYSLTFVSKTKRRSHLQHNLLHEAVTWNGFPTVLKEFPEVLSTF